MTIFLAMLLVASWTLFLILYDRPLRRLRRDLAALDPDDDPGEPGAAVLVKQIAERVTELVSATNLAQRREDDDGLTLKSILGSMPEGVALLDHQQRIRLANPALYRLLPFGLSPVNRTLLELFRNHVLQRAVDASYTAAIPQTAEILVDVQESGQIVTKNLEVSCIGLAAQNGGTLGMLTIFHDRTRLKALEGMRRDFVANVSHEFRTPLSIIGGYIETMIDDNLEDIPASRKFLKVMHQHTERLHLLVEDLLTISQLESQRASLDIQPADLQKCVEQVLERLEPVLLAKGIIVQTDFAAGFPLIELDAHRMDQVIFNLLDNAVKHGRKSDPPIEISGCFSNQEVRVSVRDLGPGIALKDQPHIFERFYRVDQARSREGGGTGLGLSIVKHVVLAHGGTVEVVSRRGEGTTFHLTLPVRQTTPTRSNH